MKPLLRGARLGRYLVLDRLGAGGMGVVWSAYDPELDRKVALKLLGVQVGGDAFVERLKREARGMAKVAHPNVVAVHDVGEQDGQLYIAMELIDGVTLREWLRQGHTRAEILAAFLSAGEGLAAAHAAGLVHRDFKPDNVLVGKDGRVCVTDFGLVRANQDEPVPTSRPPGEEAATQPHVAVVPPYELSDTAPGDSSVPSTDTEADRDGSARTLASPHVPEVVMLTPSGPQSGPLTFAGAVLGTPEYMSPEQHRGETADARSDQFSFCVALYEALYREKPFAGGPTDIWVAVTAGEVRPTPAGSGVPAHLRRTLLKGLALKASDRHASVAALLQRLRVNPTRTAVTWALRGLTAAVVTLLLTVIIQQQQRVKNRCAQLHAETASLFGPSVRLTTRAAFKATGLSFADEQFTRYEATLLAQLDDFRRTEEALCQTPPAPGSPGERTLLCVARAKAELSELVSRCSRADRDTVQNAIMALNGLSRAGACDHPDLQTDGSAFAEELRKPLIEARVSTVLGRFREAVDLCDRALEELSTPSARVRVPSSLASLKAEAWLRRGIALARLNQPSAEESLVHAIAMAEQAQSPRIAFDAWVERLLLEAIVRFDPARGEEYREHAQALLIALGNEPESELRLRNATGKFLVEQGKLAEARETYRLALKVGLAARAPDHYDVLASREGLMEVMRLLDQPEGALEEGKSILEVLQRTVPPGHPSIAIAQLRQARVLAQLQQLDRAEETVTLARAKLVESFGESNLRLALADYVLGLIAYFRHQDSNAVAQVQRALDRLDATGTATTPIAIDLWTLKADALERAGALKEAITAREKTLQLVLGREPLRHIAEIRVEFARTLTLAQQPEKASDQLQQALRDLTEAGASPQELANHRQLLDGRKR